ncbi:hypothetical protein BpOF4_16995 [Alkalihalophilus pseudofirmus OF4]|uniref:Uncharacterized protein n=1 Tax=Alkalihalophilus pseudofirmus (strain ATCC BAA-2126 / JCM 17055 / OF4) TaxID=398511 RepID=D3FQS2_ALKPO|nr:hypothetical protein BpOF4_16995 [Alkalihalophilus pseudofirmus OF4]
MFNPNKQGRCSKTSIFIIYTIVFSHEGYTNNYKGGVSHEKNN